MEIIYEAAAMRCSRVLFPVMCKTPFTDGIMIRRKFGRGSDEAGDAKAYRHKDETILACYWKILMTFNVSQFPLFSQDTVLL